MRKQSRGGHKLPKEKNRKVFDFKKERGLYAQAGSKADDNGSVLERGKSISWETFIGEGLRRGGEGRMN